MCCHSYCQKSEHAHADDIAPKYAGDGITGTFLQLPSMHLGAVFAEPAQRLTPLLLFSHIRSKAPFSTCSRVTVGMNLQSPQCDVHCTARCAVQASVCWHKDCRSEGRLTLSPRSAPPRMKATYTLFLRMNICKPAVISVQTPRRKQQYAVQPTDTILAPNGSGGAWGHCTLL